MTINKKNKNNTSKKISKSKIKCKRKRKEKRNCSKNSKSKGKDSGKENKHKPTILRVCMPCRRYEEFHDHFLGYDKILLFLQKIKKSCPGGIDLVPLGYSGNGKPIYMVIITTNLESAYPKFGTFIVAGLNGEDVFAVSNAIYIIDYLTKNPNFLKAMDYYIIPCANPDAYDQIIQTKTKNEKPCRSRKPGQYCNIEKKESSINIPKNCKSKINEEDNYSDDSCSSSDSNIRWENFIRDTCFMETNKLRNQIANYMKRKKKVPCNQIPNKKIKINTAQNCDNSPTNKNNDNNDTIRMNLTLNFPVILGLNDMRNIPTDKFLEKIKHWKVNYINISPETTAVLGAIHGCQTAVKLLISLEEGGESICYPYGFCPHTTKDIEEVKEVAKKGKCAISKRNFQLGSIYDVRGLTYGSLVDFIKVDKGSIKYSYSIQVYRKKENYNEKQELKKIMIYGCEIMESIKRMSTAVFKFYTNMTGNKKVETACTKRGLDKKRLF